MTSIIDNQKDIELFIIENNIPIKVYADKEIKSDIIGTKIYNTADKLQIGQSFLVNKQDFGELKWMYSKTNSILSKLKKVYKGKNIDITFLTKLQKDSENNETGIRIWRIS